MPSEREKNRLYNKQFTDKKREEDNEAFKEYNRQKKRGVA
jgi:hypothetical protein